MAVGFLDGDRMDHFLGKRPGATKCGGEGDPQGAELTNNPAGRLPGFQEQGAAIDRQLDNPPLPCGVEWVQCIDGVILSQYKTNLNRYGVPMKIVGAQIRMARAALGWGVRDLASKAGTTPNTISRIEGGGDALAGTLDKIEAALVACGIEFMPDGAASPGGGPGVRFKTLSAEGRSDV